MAAAFVLSHLAEPAAGVAGMARVLKLVARKDQRRAAAERLKRAMRAELVEIGPRTWTREDLIER